MNCEKSAGLSGLSTCHTATEITFRTWRIELYLPVRVGRLVGNAWKIWIIKNNCDAWRGWPVPERHCLAITHGAKSPPKRVSGRYDSGCQ